MTVKLSKNERWAEYGKKWRRRAIRSGRCGCGRKRWRDNKLCLRCIRRGRERYRKNRSSMLRSQSLRGKALHAKLKAEVFAAYGGPVCACCKERRVEFLSIDHINGAKGKRGDRRRNGSNLYRWLRRRGFPKGFRILCMNCNFSIGHFGYCPHKKRTVAA